MTSAIINHLWQSTVFLFAAAACCVRAPPQSGQRASRRVAGGVVEVPRAVLALDRAWRCLWPGEAHRCRLPRWCPQSSRRSRRSRSRLLTSRRNRTGRCCSEPNADSLARRARIRVDLRLSRRHRDTHSWMAERADRVSREHADDTFRGREESRRACDARSLGARRRRYLAARAAPACRPRIDAQCRPASRGRRARNASHSAARQSDIGSPHDRRSDCSGSIRSCGGWARASSTNASAHVTSTSSRAARSRMRTPKAYSTSVSATLSCRSRASQVSRDRI